jgi:hypothetical protein
LLSAIGLFRGSRYCKPNHIGARPALRIAIHRKFYWITRARRKSIAAAGNVEKDFGVTIGRNNKPKAAVVPV